MRSPLETLLTDDPARAAAFVRDGGCVAFPTETVYGLGADATRAEAVAAIFAAKGRPSDNPLIVHVSDPSLVASVAAEITPSARALLARFSPGPLTVILPRGPSVTASVSAGLPTVGIRVPAHPVARAFLEHCSVPVAAPSANRSGRPSPTTWQAVEADLGGRIPCILRGGRSRVGLESTVVDCSGDVPLVLRAGSVTLEALRAVVPGVRVAGPGDAEAARSPGTRHPHYAPDARVVLLDGVGHPGAGVAWIGIGPAPSGYALTSSHADAASYAHALFDFFRTCDEAGVRRVECVRVPRRGIGRALMDRVERAARASDPERRRSEP